MATDQSQKTEQEQQASLHLSVVQKMLELVTGALSLVAALAWNDAIQSLFAKLFGPASGLTAKFLYAAIVTTLVVGVILRLSRVSKAMSQKMNQSKKNL